MFLKPGTLNALMKKAYKSGLAVGICTRNCMTKPWTSFCGLKRKGERLL